MKYSFRILAAAIGVAALAALSWPAQAKVIRVCLPIGTNGTPAGQFVAKGSGTTYTRDSRGCVRITPTDLGDATALGYQIDPPVAQVYQQLAASSIVIPAAAYIDSITVQEDSGAAITGGLKIGTTSGGTDIVAAAICAASCLINIPEVSMLKRVFSATAPQTLFFGAVTNFTSGPRYTVTVHYSYF